MERVGGLLGQGQCGGRSVLISTLGIETPNYQGIKGPLTGRKALEAL